MSSSDTVLVTGATGFVASHCIKQLLEMGYRVRGTVRSKNSDKNNFLKDLPGASERLELVEADLNNADSFKPACEGMKFVMHVASPYIVTVKDPQKDLVDPAVNGTLAVLNAAKAAGTVERLILTSSVAAIADEFEPGKVYDESDWNEKSSLTRNPYYYSKTLAEKAAWDFMDKENPVFSLVVINPFAVLGKPLNKAHNTSFDLITLLGKGDFKWGAPDIAMGIVDVVDVAKSHILAMENTQAEGRYVCANVTLKILEVAEVVKDAHPELASRLPKKLLPNWLMKILARFQPSGNRDVILCGLSKPPHFNNEKIKRDLGLSFRDVKDTIRDTLEAVIDMGEFTLPQ